MSSLINTDLTQAILDKLSPYGALPAMPTADSIVTLKLLREIDPSMTPIWDNVLDQEMKHLRAATLFLMQNKTIRDALGGFTLDNIRKVSQLMKDRADEKFGDLMLKPSAEQFAIAMAQGDTIRMDLEGGDNPWAAPDDPVNARINSVKNMITAASQPFGT
jgi:hypothetical protein